MPSKFNPHFAQNTKNIRCSSIKTHVNSAKISAGTFVASPIDIGRLPWYPNAMDPDTKPAGCVKGANMDALPRKLFRGLLLPYPKGYGYFYFGGKPMETRVAVMSIIVENGDMVEKLNSLLHEYGEYIIGRMGIPYRKRKVNIIAIALDAPQNTISALSGKIGSLQGISVKTAYSSVISAEETR